MEERRYDVKKDNATKVNGHEDDAGSAEGAKNADSTRDGIEEDQNADHVFQVTVKLPHEPYEVQVMVSTQEQVQDLRQSIVELPSTFQYTCFHLEHNGEPINDFVELSDVKGLSTQPQLTLIEDPYTEKEARMHVIRIRDLVGATGNRIDTVHGISAGLSLYDSVASPELLRSPPASNGKVSKPSESDLVQSMVDYDFDASPSIQSILPSAYTPAPKTVKSIYVSAWNPPPHHLRQRGHLLYLQITTNEGEQHQITSCVSGFFVNRSSNNKFDPNPRPHPKDATAHSLLSLITKISPSFNNSFAALQEYNNKKDPLATFQLSNTLPSNPWLVSSSESSLAMHQPDITRTQETYLMSGIDSTETLREWNEEFQSTRELPRETVQDRVFRERLTSKLFADYNEAATRGAVMVARGEVAPLNPTECKDAHIFIYNNVFFSYGADGVGVFTSEGGDEAARVAVGKDVTGVRAVNQLDIPGLFTPATVVVDYMGKRIVGQSIVPGIFKQREPGENQIDYGGVEGRDVVAENEAFVPVFSKLSKALRIKTHPVWDKEGAKHTLEGSVETKGLLGTDGRKYILDMYRLTPLDISWLEENWASEVKEQADSKDNSYPHRMAVLRPELVETYWRLRMGEYVKNQLKGSETPHNGIRNNQDNIAHNKPSEVNGEICSDDESVANQQDRESSTQQDRVDVSGFDLAFNPDVFCGQTPKLKEDQEELTRDEKEVKEVCSYLQDTVIPELVEDLKEGEVGFPMDGQSLSRLMHKRGINLRYLGKLSTLTKDQNPRLGALHALAIQEMVSRAFKHIANRYMGKVPALFAGSCYAHLLNCLLGVEYNRNPKVQIDDDLRSLYPNADWSYADATPQRLAEDIQGQVRIRYRYSLGLDWTSNLKHVQLLREIALKLGLQISAKDFKFSAQAGGSPTATEQQSTLSSANVSRVNGNHVNGSNGKKKKKIVEHDLHSHASDTDLMDLVTFDPDDIVNVVPVVKGACPKSVLAEEALEAGRMSMMQNQKDLGQELLLESLSLHEQIYGILHSEVARVYHHLSMLYYQLDEKNAAVELARKAVVVFERTMGVDSDETILSYLNLSLFEHAAGNTAIALVYVRHALELWKIIYGLNHPDSITTLNNAAVMLQHMKLFHESRHWFEKSLQICEEISGKQSVSTATVSFQFAQALALDQDPKGAVNHMRDAYNIFLTKLGPEDRNTKESESWLEQLTQNAVSIAKHAKDLQARRLRRVQFNPRVTMRTHPQPQVGQSSGDVTSSREARGNIGLDSRSIEELMRFIEGGGDTSKRSSSKKQSATKNPRSRAGGMLRGQA